MSLENPPGRQPLRAGFVELALQVFRRLHAPGLRDELSEMIVVDTCHPERHLRLAPGGRRAQEHVRRHLNEREGVLAIGDLHADDQFGREYLADVFGDARPWVALPRVELAAHEPRGAACHGALLAAGQPDGDAPQVIESGHCASVTGTADNHPPPARRWSHAGRYRRDMKRSPRAEVVGWAIAALLVVIGLTVAVVAMVNPVTTGWFAYAPLSGSISVGTDGVIVPRSAIVGVVVLVVGLIGLSYLAGRRSRSTR